MRSLVISSSAFSWPVTENSIQSREPPPGDKAGVVNIFEMTWASDGGATFAYGPEVTEGQPHVVWRRVGTHTISK